MKLCRILIVAVRFLSRYIIALRYRFLSRNRYVPVSDENGLVFFHHRVAQSFQFYQHQTSLRNFDGGAKYRWGIKFLDFLPISHYVSQTIQYIAIVTIEGE